METNIDKLIEKPIDKLRKDQLKLMISHYESYQNGYSNILKALYHELISRLENDNTVLSYENTLLQERNLKSINSFSKISDIISNNYLS